MLSAPADKTADTLEKFIADTEALIAEQKRLYKKIASYEAEKIEITDKNAVAVFDGWDIDTLREFVNSAISRVGGMLVALSDSADGYKYVIGSNSEDMGAKAREINSALCGRGGGRGKMIQGTFFCGIEKITEYFK